MKIKLYTTTLLIMVVISMVNAQNNYYYYYQGQKVYMNLDKTTINISVFNQFQKSSLNNLQLKEYDLENDNSQNTSSNLKYAKIEFQFTPSDNQYFEKLNSIKNKPNVRTVYPSFVSSNGSKVGLSDYLYVKLKNPSDYSLLQQKANQYNIDIIEQNQFMPLWYTLRCNENTLQSSLELANILFETSLFASSIPDLLVDDLLLCANDTNFGDLWGLNNSSNPNVDINACAAWIITEGNGINVAILDQGIELTHNDLQNNISQNSYDTESNSSPSQIFGNHGTHVAGTVSAIKDNNLQVVGVAPQSTLMSISNSLSGTPNSRIRRADGINWAWQNGADVINNSWGSGVQYDVIDDAIESALNNGRNGLGTIVIFASGNDFGGVGYPANSNSNILAVGAIASNGNRSNFSNFGNELDIVAPGSAILSTINNNGTDTFNGTSMAAPHVAGVAALILSVNPNLTVQEVNTIIESSAQKIGGYSYLNNSNRPNGTWNDEMGYGLVDAYAAVQMAQQFTNSELEDIDIVCYNNSKTIQLSDNQNNPVSWQVSSNLTLLSSDNSSITVSARFPNSTGNGWVKATLNNGITLQEDFWVGLPSSNNLIIISSGSFNISTQRWYQLTAHHTNFSYFEHGSLEYEWLIPYAQLRLTPPKNKVVSVFPSQTGTYPYKLRSKNECGCSAYITNLFQISNQPGDDDLFISPAGF